MCAHMMTVDMYEIMCTAADYVGIGVLTYAEIAGVFTMNLIYRDETEGKIDARMCKAFLKGIVV